MKPPDFISNARAKILWGEPSSSVRDFLIANGISDSDADNAIEEICAERNKEIRKIAIKKTFLGAAITAGTGILLFSFIPEIANYDTSNSLIGARGLPAVAVVIMIGGYYGLSRLIDGIMYLVRPESKDGCISEM
jgi:hypothetical protein